MELLKPYWSKRKNGLLELYRKRDKRVYEDV